MCNIHKILHNNNLLLSVWVMMLLSVLLSVSNQETWGMMGKKQGLSGKLRYRNTAMLIKNKYHRLYHFAFKSTIYKHKNRPLPPPKNVFPIIRLYSFPTPGEILKAFLALLARRQRTGGRRGVSGGRRIGRANAVVAGPDRVRHLQASMARDG